MVGGVSSAHLIQPTPQCKNGGNNDVTRVSENLFPLYKMTLRLQHVWIILSQWKQRVCTFPFKLVRLLN